MLRPQAQQVRNISGPNWLEGAWQDLRYGFRTLRRSPAFTLTAWLMLSCVMGLNLTIFRIVNATVLQPPRLKHPSTLVRMERRLENRGSSRSWSVPYSTAEFLRHNSDALSAVLTQRFAMDASWGREGEEPLRAAYVSANFFTELGYGAARGRVFAAASDERVDSPPVAVLSHDFWRGHLNQDPDIIGRSVWINRQQASVVGVASLGFPGLRLDDIQVWLLVNQIDHFEVTELYSRHCNVELYGRLRPGVPIPVAKERLRITLGELSRQNPAVWQPGEWLELYSGSVRFQPEEERSRNWLAAVLAGSLGILVLLVACTNVGGLLLLRGLGRIRELAVRSALGASRQRIVRQFAVESVLLAVLAAVAGVFLSHWTAPLISARLHLPGYLDSNVGWRLPLVAFAAVALAATVLGWPMAWRLSRTNLVTTMKDGGQSLSRRLYGTVVRRALVITQVAGGSLLLAVSGLTARGLQRMLSPSGFEFERVAVLEAPASSGGINGNVAQAYLMRLRSTIEAYPETESVTIASLAPLGQMSSEATYRDAAGLRVTSLQVERGFFSLMRIPILLGRSFVASDSPRTTVIVSRRLAMEMYGTVNVLGQMFPRGYKGRRIVGVTGDAPLVNYRAPDVAELYAPLDPGGRGHRLLLVRAKTDPARLLGPLKLAGWAADDRVRPRVRLLRDDFAQKVHVPRLLAYMVGGAASLAVVLACFGVYGVVSYAVHLRTKELGVRLALGAPQHSIIGLLWLQFGVLVSLSALVGACAAAPVGMVLESRLSYMRWMDAPVYAATVLVLVISGSLAGLLPVSRLLRMGPLSCIRHD